MPVMSTSTGYRSGPVAYPELARELAVADKPRYVVAAEAGICPSVLSAIVHGRRVPNPDQRRRLARVLGVPAAHLFG